MKPKLLHEVPVHVLGCWFLELRDGHQPEDGEEGDDDPDVDDCAVGVDPHRLGKVLNSNNFGEIFSMEIRKTG